jgi:Mn-dependent DtxR family transcriptional regulator
VIGKAREGILRLLRAANGPLSTADLVARAPRGVDAKAVSGEAKRLVRLGMIEEVIGYRLTEEGDRVANAVEVVRGVFPGKGGGQKRNGAADEATEEPEH